MSLHNLITNTSAKLRQDNRLAPLQKKLCKYIFTQEGVIYSTEG